MRLLESVAITKINLGLTFDLQQLFDLLFYRVKTLRHPIFLSDGLFQMSNRLIKGLDFQIYLLFKE